MDTKLLGGRVALVTGGSRGIGAATCKRLAEHGAAVVVNYLSNHEAAQCVAEDIARLGGRVLLAPGDISQEQVVQTTVGLAKQEFGGIDILVNNAFPGFHGGTIEELAWETYQLNFDQMVRAAYHTVRAVLPGMKNQRWGRIVNLGTTAMYDLNPLSTAYISGKGALLALTRGLARDLGPFNICVNMVSPGLVYTGPAPQPENWGSEHARRSALGRNPSAREVAGAVVFLASSLADGVTGLQIPVCCGLLMHVG